MSMSTTSAQGTPAYWQAACYENRGSRQPLLHDVDLDYLWDEHKWLLHNCSIGCLFRVRQKLKDYWLSDDLLEINRPEDAAAEAIRLFKLDAETLTPTSINLAYSRAMMQVTRVLMALNQACSRIAMEEAAVRAAKKDFNRMMRVIHGLHQLLQASYDVHSALRGTDSYISSDLLELQRFMPVDEARAGQLGALVRHITQRLSARRLKRCGEDVYEEIIVNGHHTHAWRRLKSIKEFIYEHCSRHQDVEAWSQMMGQRGIVNQVKDYLMDANDIEFLELQRDRHVFSFRNGIYIAYKRPPELEENEQDCAPSCTFIYYTELEDPNSAVRLDDDVVAINYFDMDMPTTTVDAESLEDIATPKFDKIFADQGIPPDAMLWIYALTGRLFYDLRELDDWEVLLFIRGVANSGKSTLGRILKKIYPAECVGHLSSNVQKKFALEGVYDKLIWMCFEIKSNWSDNIDQADLQSIISGGEEVVICRKFKGPLHHVWTAPGIIFGNESGGWVDCKGSITRRVVPVEFNTKIKAIDTRLFKALNHEIPNIIVKCNRAYHVAVELFVPLGIDIWEALTQDTDYFKETQIRLRRETNSFADFLESTDKLERSDDKWIPYSDFVAEYRDYCKRNGTRPQRLSLDNIESHCSDSGLDFIDGEELWVPWKGTTCHKSIHRIGYKSGMEPPSVSFKQQ